MRKRALAALATSFTLLAAGPAAALAEGVPDGNGHPNVGLLTFDVDGPGETPPFALCTGFVVSESVFLTAAHCIAALPEGVQWGVALAPGGPGDPVFTPGFFPYDFPFAVSAPVSPALASVVHPEHGVGWRDANDVAVVLFPEGTFGGVTPVDLPETGLLDRLAATGGLRGESFTLVGYGTEKQQDNGPPRLFAAGYRQTATAPFQALTPMHLRLQLTTAASGGGALCAGDSGSPQFLGDSNLAVSLLTNSNRSDSCGGAQAMQRLDTPAVRAFLAQYVEQP
jgi:hypothetical protein